MSRVFAALETVGTSEAAAVEIKKARRGTTESPLTTQLIKQMISTMSDEYRDTDDCMMVDERLRKKRVSLIIAASSSCHVSEGDFGTCRTTRDLRTYRKKGT
jgi:hypothetical protein